MHTLYTGCFEQSKTAKPLCETPEKYPWWAKSASKAEWKQI